MRRIAVLGANSQLASDLLRQWAQRADLALDLYARQPHLLPHRVQERGCAMRPRSYDQWPVQPRDDEARYDAIINFVGVGDPAQAAAMGTSILDVTLHYDNLALGYLTHVPTCRYLFLSSGAVYGRNFAEPVSADSIARVAINGLGPHDYYGVAKLTAEIRHRAMAEHHIVDLRVFNIFSRTQNINARFLITDMVRAIRDDAMLEVDSSPMVRDYLHPCDFAKLVDACLSSPPANLPIDAYSRAPVSKAELLESMTTHFGLRWKIRPGPAGINATGQKPHYYSLNRLAAGMGYEPSFTSLETVLAEAGAMLGKRAPTPAGQCRSNLDESPQSSAL